MPAARELFSNTCFRDPVGVVQQVFEYHLHPSRYRTQLCNDGANCSRKICECHFAALCARGCLGEEVSRALTTCFPCLRPCAGFFAHSMEELRVSSVKVVPPDSAANKVSSPGGSPDFDSVDPFSGQGDDAVSALKQRSSTSPVSPLYSDAWDPLGSHEPPTRRSSLQLQQKQQQQQRQHRMSMDQIGMRPQRLMHQPRNSVDLASELQIQQLQLSALKAQLQLQQTALHTLGAQADPGASVAQLAQALAQLQIASNLASAEQLLPAAALQQQQQQQLVPNLTQVLMQQMILQQQAQAQAQVQAQVQAQAQGQLLQQLHGQAMAGQADMAASGLGVGMLIPNQQATLSPGYSLPIPGTSASLPDYSPLSKMPSLPSPDLSFQSLQASAFGVNSPPLLSPSPMSALDGVFSHAPFSSRMSSGITADGDEASAR